jgi:uncharacterized protein
MAQSTPDPSKIAKGKCPICGEATAYEQRPFCSRRCANIDLYRWMSGSYAIAGREDGDEDGDEAKAHSAPSPAAGRSGDDADD